MLIYFNIVEPLVCKTVTRLLGGLLKNEDNCRESQTLCKLEKYANRYQKNNILKTLYRNLARPTSVHCNHRVSSSVRPICFPHISFAMDII